MHLRQILPFLILMEKDDGLESKAPSYIMEKIEASYNSKAYRLLDRERLNVLYNYLKKWKILHSVYTESELDEITEVLREK